MTTSSSSEPASSITPLFKLPLEPRPNFLAPIETKAQQEPSTTTTKGTPVHFICDCETTGTDEMKTDLLTLFAAVTDEDLNILDTISLTIKPDSGIYRVDPGAMRVNKIHIPSHDQEAATRADSAKSLYAFLYTYCKVGYFKNGNKKVENKLVFAGHNCPFDRKFIREFLKDQPLGEDDLFERHSLDTGANARLLLRAKRLPKEVGTSLPRLMKHYGVEYGAAGAHNAEADTIATLEVLRKQVASIAG